MNKSNQQIYQFLNNLREKEENQLPRNEFVAHVPNCYKYIMSFIAVFGITVGALAPPGPGIAAGVPGIISLLALPSYFTYRCHVTKEFMKMECFFLCFKIKKEILWRDIKYKSVKRDRYGTPLILRLYDSNKKKRIRFDFGIVGFDEILRKARNIPKR